MNYVEIGLTRALKQVSGWTDTPDQLVKFSLAEEPLKLPNMDGTTIEVSALAGMKEWTEPYYDTPYLLKMLPPFLAINGKAHFLALMTANTDEEPSYVAAYYHYLPMGPNGLMKLFAHEQCKAKQPQDALAKLAFKLFLHDMIWKIPEVEVIA